jgi:hypothetical protein
MTWKLFAQALRLVNRPGSSPKGPYRPHLDALEDRTVLSTVIFNEVQSQSILALSGTVDGKKLKPQGPGALTTTYFGTFETNIDEAAGTIRFIQTGNDFCAANTGNWAPLENGGDGTAPAIYGFQMKRHQMVLEAAVRDFHVNADTGGVSLPLYQNDDGSFGFPSAQTIAISAGSGTFSQPTLGHGPLNFGGMHAANQAGDGRLIDNGRGTLTITVPISVSVSGTISGIDFTLNLNGQIVGTANYPAPGQAGHGRHDATIGTALALGTQASAATAATDTNVHGLGSESLRNASVVPVSMPASVGSERLGDTSAQPVRHAASAAVDPLTALDAVLRELAS